MGVVTAAEAAAAHASRRALAEPVARFRQALDLALGNPSLWLIGTAAFMLRGGIFLLLVPLIALPTPVEIRLLVGGGLGSSGPTGGLLVAILGFAITVTLLLMLAMYAVSWLEAWAFDRQFPPATETEVVAVRRVVGRVFSVQAGAVSAVALAAIPVVLAAINVAYNELIRPSGDGSLYDKIIGGIPGPLLFLAAAIAVVEAVSAIATRRLLFSARAGSGTPSHRRWRPVTALAGWLVTLIVLGPALWALNVTWRVVRQRLDGALSPDPLAVVPQIVALAAVWGATLVLCGFASALRGALWAMQERR